MTRSLSLSFDEALHAVPVALAAQGFSVLTTLDMQAILQQKLGVDFRRYKILGVCNPQFALRALTADIDAGVMLPCNVVVYEDDDRLATVTILDPRKSIAAERDDLLSLAEDVRTRLELALDALPARLAAAPHAPAHAAS